MTSPNFTATQAGSYRWVAKYSGDVNNEEKNTACSDPLEISVVNKASPTLSTNASGPVTVGATIHDTATISGLIEPTATGTINFKLYGPGDTTCQTPLNGAGGQNVTVNKVPANNSYDSPNFTATQAGTYRWIANYSGDVNNAEETGACSDPLEISVVDKASPRLRSRRSAPPAVTVGATITDTATLSGLRRPHQRHDHLRPLQGANAGPKHGRRPPIFGR